MSLKSNGVSSSRYYFEHEVERMNVNKYVTRYSSVATVKRTSFPFKLLNIKASIRKPVTK